jgi:hypothetical protein
LEVHWNYSNAAPALLVEVAEYLVAQVANEQQLLSCESELKRIEELNSEAIFLWNPIKKRLVPWIDLKKSDKIYFHQP